MGDEFLGAEVMAEHGGWNILCKFFDNLGPIPHHMHQMDEHAAKVGQKGKPEAYYFPPQYNFTATISRTPTWAWSPAPRGTTCAGCLERWNQGDNGILYHAKAYKLQPGTGWQVDAGVLHAPGSLVTYEPQVNSDVFGMFQSMVENRPVPWELLVKDVPPEHHHDLDYIIGMLDWDKNVDPEFGKHNKVFPKPVQAGGGDGRRRLLARSGSPMAGRALFRQGTDRVPGPNRRHPPTRRRYGVILTQGWGSAGKMDVETPTLIRFGEMTKDEVFVTPRPPPAA